MQLDPHRPFGRTLVKLDETEDVFPSDVSTMPARILNIFDKKDCRDLLDYHVNPGEDLLTVPGW